MTNDLEQLLRDTMHNRADTITTGPTWRRPAEGPTRHSRARWIAPLAAAAAVAAVAIGIAVVPEHHAPPAQHTGAPLPSPSPTPTHPKPTKVAIPASCPTTLPKAWQTAMRNSLVYLGGMSNIPLSALPDGTVAVAHDAGPQPGDTRSVLLTRPGHAPQTAYTVSSPDRYDVASAYLSGHWLVVVESLDPRPPKDTEPGSSPMPNVHRLVVVDRTTGSRKVIAAMRANGTGPYIDSASVIDGRVYWDVREKYGARDATIYSYGLGAGDTRTEYDGAAGYLFMSTVSIHDAEGRTFAQRALPPVVDRAVGSAVSTVVTDGADWAWARPDQSVGWWRPGMAAPKYVKVPVTFIDFDGGGGGGISVGGQYVMSAAVDPTVVDMRTGAAAPVAGSVIYGGHDSGQYGVANADGLATGLAYEHDGHYVNGYWTDGRNDYLRLDLSALPELRC